MPQPHRGSLVRLRRAIGFVRAVECAVEVGLLGPLHVVCNYEIEFAVAVVIHPRGAGGELVWTEQAGGPGDIGESAVAIVVEEMALSKSGDEDVIETVVVIVADCHSHAEHGHGQSGLAGYIGKSSIAIVVVQLWGCRPTVSVSGEVIAVNQ